MSNEGEARPLEVAGREDAIEAALDLLRDGARLTLVGPPGVGRRTLARALAEHGFSDVSIAEAPRGVHGEHVLTVLPLDTRPHDADSAAVRLWTRRARAHDAAWRRVGHEARAVADLVRELDGWPLALELSVPLARTMGVAALCRRLAARECFAAFAPLDAALRASFEAMPTPLRRAVVRLSVVEGEARPDDAAQVIGGADPWSALAQLRTRGWLRFGADAPESVALLRTIRRALVDVMDADEQADARRVWAERCFLSPLDASDATHVPDLIALASPPHHDEDRKDRAFEALRRLDEITWLREPPPQLPGLLDAALVDESRPEPRATLLEIRARQALRRRALDDARADLEEARALTSDPSTTLDLRRSLQELASLAGDAEGAVAAAEATLADAANEPAPRRARLARSLGTLRRRAGDDEGACVAFEEALASMPSTRDPLRAAVLAERAMLELERGQLEVARELAERARRVVDATGLTYVGAYLHAALAAASHAAGSLEDARREYTTAAGYAERLSDPLLPAVLAAYRALLRVEVGDAEARLDLHDAIEELGRVGAPRDVATTSALFALLDARAGRLDGSRASLARLGEVPDGSSHARVRELVAAAVDVAEHRDEASAARLHRARDAALRGGNRARDGAYEGVTDLRLALRLTSELATPAPTPEELRIGRDGVVRLPGGRHVDLARRPLLLRLLRALANHHADARGEALDVDALLAAGWPGERMVADSGARRLQVAIGRLRESGLREVLESVGAGYRLSPRWRVAVELDQGSTG
ncbi:MAG: hypothetical protein H6720_20685 [Sandaracinus sp.]|nr:hypothetical protein [Sandaracinus sp.]MCB9622260.1 hypothetical protein [Sandaracinus sp.]